MAVELRNRDYIWSYVGVILSLFANVVMTPFVIYFLDGDMYGLWSVFQSLAAITVLFDFGFSTTFARNINYCWNGASALERKGVQYAENREPNFALMKKTMRACQMVFLLISIAALLIMLTAGTIYIRHISAHIPGNAPMIAWIVCAVAIFLNLYFGYYNSFLRGVGAISEVNKVTVIAKLTQIILTVLLLACGAGIIGTSVAYLVYGTVFRQLGKRGFNRYKGIGKGLIAVETKTTVSEVKHLFFVVWYNAWREGLVSFSNYLANQACTLICSLYMPLVQTGAYSLAVQLATAVSQVSAAMYTANQPVLQSAYINKDKKRVKSTMALIVISFVMLNVLGLAAAIFIGLPLLRLIKPETVVGSGVMLGVGIYQFILKFRNCYTSYYSCTNRIPYVKAFLVSSALCVLMSIVTLGYFHLGIWGLIGAQLVSQCVYNAWIWPARVHRELELSIMETVVLGWQEIKKIGIGFTKKG